MFELSEGEQIVESLSPVNDKGQLHTCSECSQIAFRIIVLRSPKGERKVGLCGAHYVSACAAHPGLRHKG